jgi:hypothetical protein
VNGIGGILAGGSALEYAATMQDQAWTHKQRGGQITDIAAAFGWGDPCEGDAAAGYNRDEVRQPASD